MDYEANQPGVWSRNKDGDKLIRKIAQFDNIELPEKLEITVKVKGEEKQAQCYVMKEMTEYTPPDEKYMEDVLLTIKTFYQLSMGMVTKLKLSLPIIRADTMEEQEQRLLEL